jgi:hypothetical protein
MRLCQRMFGSGRCVVLNSGFCVLEAIAELLRQGVYAASLIKTQHFWPKHVKGQEIFDQMNDKELGQCEAQHGVVIINPFTIFALQEQKYVLMKMSSYGTMERQGKELRQAIIANGKLTTTKFQYPEVIVNHYKYRHMVDNHNSYRHAPISLEETWATSTWTHHVLAFLLAITKVNMGLWI